jgi:hypothetical protein
MAKVISDKCTWFVTKHWSNSRELKFPSNPETSTRKLTATQNGASSSLRKNTEDFVILKENPPIKLPCEV